MSIATGRIRSGASGATPAPSAVAAGGKHAEDIDALERREIHTAHQRGRAALGECRPSVRAEGVRCRSAWGSAWGSACRNPDGVKLAAAGSPKEAVATAAAESAILLPRIPKEEKLSAGS